MDLPNGRRREVRCDLVELAWIGFFCVVTGIGVGSTWFSLSPSDMELAPLARRFGPERSSQHYEEWVIRDFFADKKEGFFVDVGASDYRKFSNTYFLEKGLEWSGIAIDALPQFAEGYRQHRPRTRFFPFFVSDRSGHSVTLHVLPSDLLVSSEQKSFTARWGKGAQQVQVRTTTLDDLLTSEKVGRIDLLSMDIELAEPKALAGFTISRFRPALVCIEAHPEVRQAILDYFAKNNYAVVGRYLRADLFNLYFTPRN